MIMRDADKNISIGNYCIIEEGVVIGEGTVIKNYVELRSGTVIGKNCFIDSYVVSSGDNYIGNNVILRYGAIVAKGCHLEDCVYFAPRVMTNNLDHMRRSIGGACVEEGVFVGTHAVLSAGIRICRGVTVGAQAFVSKSLAESGVYVGVPARLIRVQGGL